jgi:two-component system copper resistance phosphate regulon response regulator CusR
VRILLVEDEPREAGFIVKGLRKKAYAVDIAASGEEAIYSASQTDYDLIILDLMLIKGIAVCKRLRESGLRRPILILTDRDAVGDRVAGLDCGADDCLTKPFDFKELLARLRALLRRPLELQSQVLQVADLKLNTADHSVIRRGRSIRLTAKEYALLEFLMLRANRVVDREQIAQHLWDENFHPFSNVIDVYVRRLRAKVDRGFERPLIGTRRGEGYMLSGEPANKDV